MLFCLWPVCTGKNAFVLLYCKKQIRPQLFSYGIDLHVRAIMTSLIVQGNSRRKKIVVQFVSCNTTKQTQLFPLQTGHKQNNTTCNLFSMKIKLYSYNICQLSHKQISLTRNFVWICPQSYPCNDVKADDVNATVTSFLALTPFLLITPRTLWGPLAEHITNYKISVNLIRFQGKCKAVRAYHVVMGET